jgi:hypothetical protein
MSFQIQITVDSIAEAERILACLRHDNPPAAQQVNAQVESGKINPEVAPTKPRGRPRKESAALAATESAAPVATATDDQSPNQPDQVQNTGPAQQTPPTFDDAKAALQALLARHDGDMTVPLQVLASFDAQRISAVKEADWPAFIAACKAA